ncbi:hypothetical protein HIM_01345 [Hirsutella minnesotensis 3608]|nr:hypothetical protein HIM_01345 [Hirsutella minnesotensis 3608]
MTNSSSSASSVTSSSPAPAAASTPGGLGQNRGITFQIKTGNARWQCTLQDRAAYERMKAARTSSVDSISSAESTAPSSPRH